MLSDGDRFFIEASSGSEDEQVKSILRKTVESGRETAERGGGSSPPVLLVFSENGTRDTRQSLSDSTEEDSDQSVEDWMILGRGSEEGDSCIRLNLCYWSTSEEEEDENKDVKPVEDPWLVSERDKNSQHQHLPRRYFMTDHIPAFISRLGTRHLSRTTQFKKSPTCFLCGLQGHLQKNCPGRPCLSCGLPAHGPRPCDSPPVWHQYCQRCGAPGHLADVCPDTWRQYHVTVRPEVPLRPAMSDTHRLEQRLPQCYNCAERGHYGHECPKRRMISGMFLTLPYVCHYDTLEDVLVLDAKRQKDRPTAGRSSRGLTEETESGEDGKRQSRRRTPTWSSKRKTWPDRRRERREVKRLKREAQARRHGGLSLKSQVCPDENVYTSNKATDQKDLSSPKKKEGCCGRKSRERERWTKSKRIGRHDGNCRNLSRHRRR